MTERQLELPFTDDCKDVHRVIITAGRPVILSGLVIDAGGSPAVQCQSHLFANTTEWSDTIRAAFDKAIDAEQSAHDERMRILIYGRLEHAPG